MDGGKRGAPYLEEPEYIEAQFVTRGRREQLRHLTQLRQALSRGIALDKPAKRRRALSQRNYYHIFTRYMFTAFLSWKEIFAKKNIYKFFCYESLAILEIFCFLWKNFFFLNMSGCAA